jgi:DoxX-like family
MRVTKTRVVYWIATILFVLPLAWSAVLYFTEAPKMVETMTHLGYPLYFMKILGTAKLLGVAALLYPGFPRLKEWAYAGFTFDLIGAFCSHLASGDPIYIALVPIGFLALLAISYWCWKAPDRHVPAR